MFKSKEPKFKLDLGSEVECRITGFKGIIISRTQWLHNCSTYQVKPQKLNKEGETLISETFDEPQLKAITPNVIKSKQNTGGPAKSVQRTNRL